MSRNLFAILASFVLCFSAFPQIKVGQWKDHLSYNSCNTVAKVGDDVYVSNGTGLVKYKISDGSIETISKINGLSDIGISLLRYNPYNGVLLIVYENANIDVLRGDELTNFSDIKAKTLTAKKDINEVTFKNNLAYLSCGFGIVVFDTDKLEVKDTYLVGPNGSYTNVYQVETTDTTIFAATDIGLLKANKFTLLNNFQNWKLVTGIPAGTYNGIVTYKNKIVANYSPYTQNATMNKDTLYNYDGVSWSKYSIKPFPYIIKKLFPTTNKNYLSVVENYGLEIYDVNEVPSVKVNAYPFGGVDVKDVFPDFSAGTYYIADRISGFIISKGNAAFFPNYKINVNGTHSNLVNNIDIYEGIVACSPIKIDETGVAQFSPEGLNIYDGSEWSYWRDPAADSVFDYCYAYVDRKDPNRVWTSSWYHGLLEYRNGKVVNVFNSLNSAIPSLPSFFWHRVAGLSMDEDGNLWIGGSDVQNFLTVRKANGTFQNFNFTGPAPFIGRVLADKHGQVWVTFPRSGGVIGMHNGTLYSTSAGIAVYKNNNFAAPGPGNSKFITLSEGQGKLPDPYVFGIAEDHDGQIWVGTSKGVAVFYNPENIFSGGNYDAQQILITQDNHVQILLETEKVTAIAVDGGNRKWIGTEASGVYCFTPDGQSQIYHFTAENSPLFSNLVHDIAYNGKTGDVFIGTDQGIQSYRTEIVDGEKENCNAVHAYPNPVKPAYNGNVYVRGLMDQSVVKITDINSNLVWETKSTGGQIEWGLKNIQGKKVRRK